MHQATLFSQLIPHNFQQKTYYIDIVLFNLQKFATNECLINNILISYWKYDASWEVDAPSAAVCQQGSNFCKYKNCHDFGKNSKGKSRQ